MPHKKLIVQYSDGQFQFKAPFIMYADFESIPELIQGAGNDPMISSTRGVNNHVPSGWCVCSEFAYVKVENPLKLYKGKDCIKNFCDHVIGEALCLYQAFPEKPIDPLTKAQLKKYEEVSRCYICFKSFNGETPKMRDHCHYTGSYRGPTHVKCNLMYKIPSYIPIVFHNLLGYDAHLFIKELASLTDGSCGPMDVIAKNTEDYISFSIKGKVDESKETELRFIDSSKFMNSSLDSLVNNLAGGGERFFGFEEYNQNQYNLPIKKGIYPFEYMNDWDKFKETKLPPKEAFYSKLNMTGVREEDYEHANRVWKEFGLKDLGNTMIYT